jgi:hypothetical protein
MADTFEGYATRTITRGFFRSMVGRAMFCASCQRVLDYRRAVLFGTHIVCAPCYQRVRDNAVAKSDEAAVSATERDMAARLDFIDGRKLGGR